MKMVIFKVAILATTLFLFFTTTTLVSFTLRETQDRMLKFTYLLQHNIRNRKPIERLVFMHVVESLIFVPIMVGILFFLFEFFGDQLLAIYVLTVVWLCEVFSVISMRTLVCMQFFPRVFFAYFALFHIYFFSCPFGFSFLALGTTVLFLCHSFCFFFNRFEIPAFESGIICEGCPRMGGVPSMRGGGGLVGVGVGGRGAGGEGVDDDSTHSRTYSRENESYNFLRSPYGNNSNGIDRNDSFAVGEGVILDDMDVTDRHSFNGAMTPDRSGTASPFIPPSGMQTELSVPLLGSFAFSFMNEKVRSGTSSPVPPGRTIAPQTAGEMGGTAGEKPTGASTDNSSKKTQ